VIAETSRLKIRQLTVDDAAFVLRLTNEPSTIENIGDKGLRTIDDAEQFILEGPWTEQHDQGYGQFAIELKTDNELIGVCGILYRTKLELTDVGFALLPAFWRQGFAFEAASAVMDYGHDVLGVYNITGLTSDSNMASISLLEKLGMRYQKMVSMSGDRVADTRVYSEFGLTSSTSQKASAD